MKWVTWENVGIDRIGCAWLILRVLWMATPIIVIDTYEHAFYVDHQNRKADYVEKFMAHIDWAEAALRFSHS